jgi:DNA-binding transcriptional ArsR family regulator
LWAANGRAILTNVEPIGNVFAALADPTRRAILEGLRARPRAVADIADDFRISRPAVSQHLKVLQGAGLLRRRRRGRQNFYGLDLRGITVLRNYVDRFWTDVLAAFQAAAIEEADKPPGRK